MVSAALTYPEAIILGAFQGVTELFPVSSLGHSVLIPALIGGSWKNLDVTAKDSPYLAFIVGMHVATAIAMIIYFWRDWLRIVRGFFSSFGQMTNPTPGTRRFEFRDIYQKLAWMIILGTIPVGIAGVILDHPVRTVLAKPTPTAIFLALNGLLLFGGEFLRRRRAGLDVAQSPGGPATAAVNPADGWGGPLQGGPQRGDYRDRTGYSERNEYRDQSRHGEQGYRDQGGYGNRGYDDRGGYSAQGYDGRDYGDQRGQGGQGGYGGRPGYADQPGGYPDQRDFGAQPSFTDRRDLGGQPGYTDRPQAGDRRAGGQGYDDGYGRRDQRGYDQRGYDQGSYDERGGHASAAGGNGQWGNDPRGYDQGGYDQGGYDPRRGDQGGYDRRGYDQGDYDQGGRGDDGYRGRRPPRQQPPQQHQSATSEAPLSDREQEALLAVQADRRLSRHSWLTAIALGASQILALFPGFSRDGSVMVAGMARGLSRQDAVRFSFLLSAPVIFAAGVFKANELLGPETKGIHGPILAGMVVSGICAYLALWFLDRLLSNPKRTLTPFAIYCLIAGIASLLILG
jgi:undecaprenyl pyrophosphate phosphatase UppP